MLDTPKAFVATVILVYFSANLPDFDKAGWFQWRRALWKFGVIA